jgi:hypothetical protein
MIMFNIKLLRALIVFTLLNMGSSAWAAQCVPDASGAIPNAGCDTEPSSYIVKIYQIGVCSAQPVAPTSGGAAADLGNCTTVFENAAGSSISVQKGVSTVLSGTFTAPPVGSYSYAYAILDPTIQVKAGVTFQNSQTVVGNDGVTPVASKGSGAKCWTLDTTFKDSNGVRSDTLDCGSNFGPVGTVSDIVDMLDGGSADPQSCVTPPGSNMTACITDSALKQTATATVTRLLLIYNNLTLSFASGKNLDMAFGVSTGVGLISSGVGLINGMIAGPIDITFSIK